MSSELADIRGPESKGANPVMLANGANIDVSSRPGASVTRPAALLHPFNKSHSGKLLSQNQSTGVVMAKYYVESGDLKLVVHANSSRGAALWAVHRTLAQVLPFVGDEPSSPSDQPATALAQPTRLAETVRVHQQGFGRPDSREFQTLPLVTQWNQLLLAVDRLQEALVPAGCT